MGKLADNIKNWIHVMTHYNNLISENKNGEATKVQYEEVRPACNALFEVFSKPYEMDDEDKKTLLFLEKIDG